MRKEYIFFSCREEEEEVPRKRLSSKGEREGEGREKNESESVAVGWIGRRKRSGGFWVAVAVLGLWRGEKIGPVARSWAGNCWNFFWFEAVATPRKRAGLRKGGRRKEGKSREREGRKKEIGDHGRSRMCEWDRIRRAGADAVRDLCGVNLIAPSLLVD